MGKITEKEVLNMYGIKESQLTKSQRAELKKEVATMNKGGAVFGGVLQNVSPYTLKKPKK